MTMFLLEVEGTLFSESFFLPQFLFLSINYEGLESLDALPWILLQRSLVVFKRCYMVY